jgi:hypothetical protein
MLGAAFDLFLYEGLQLGLEMNGIALIPVLVPARGESLAASPGCRERA